MTTTILAENLSLSEAIEFLEELVGTKLSAYAELFARDPVAVRYKVQMTQPEGLQPRYKIVR